MGGEGPERRLTRGCGAFGRARHSALAPGRLSDWVVTAPFVLTVGVLLVGPAVNLVLDSLRSSSGFTLGNWADIFRLALTRQAIVSSVLLSVLVASLSTVIGGLLAWCISRLGLRGRSLGVAAMNVAANMSATTLVFGFTAAFGGAGFATLLLRQLWPAVPTLDLYGPTGLVFVYLYFHVPLFVLLTLPAMGAVSEQLWEAATVCGAAPTFFWRRVGVPVLLPFLLAGWMLMFAWAIGQYGVPLSLLGTSEAVPLMTLRIGALIQTAGTTNRFERAACLSVLLVVLSVVALWLYAAALRRAARWVK
jgi:putative spermidine/putrescine transport system permease protein